MKPAYPFQSNLWGTGAAVVTVILLLGFSIRSLLLVADRPKPAGAAGLEPPAAAAERQPVAVANHVQGTINHEHAAGPVAAPSPAPASPVPASKKTSEFTVDYKTLSEREAGRKDTIKNLREIARDNPESGYAMTEEQLRKFDKSGGSFQ